MSVALFYLSDMRLSCRDAANQASRDSEVLRNSGPGWLRHDKTDAYRTFSVLVPRVAQGLSGASFDRG
jgi:hypothetical protein